MIVRHPRFLFWSSDDLSNNEIILINNKLLKIFVILLLLSVAPAHAGKTGVAATVQGVEISELKLQYAIDNYLRQQGTDIGAIRNPEQFKVMREKVLDVLIGQELMWQVAKKEQTMATDEEVSQAFDQAAFDLVEPGDVSGIVETRFGLHLIQLIDKKPSVKVEEADASEQIKIYLWQQGYRRAVGGAVENLKEQAVIQKSN